MQQLMENWRAYYNEDFDLLCERYDKGHLSEERLFLLWEDNINREYQTLLNEGIMDILAVGYEKGKELVGRAKEAYDAAVQKVNDFILNLSLQAWNLIQKTKVLLSKIAGVLQKAFSWVSKFCDTHPIICKAAKLLLMMLAVAAVLALFSSEAQAAIDTSGMGGGEGATLSDTGVDAIKGFLQIGTEDRNPEIQQQAVDALRWLEEAHASEQLVDLANSTGEGADFVRRLYANLKETSQEDPTFIRYLAEVGEKVVVKVNRYTETVNIQGDVTIKRIEWESLTTK